MMDLDEEIGMSEVDPDMKRINELLDIGNLSENMSRMKQYLKNRTK